MLENVVVRLLPYSWLAFDRNVLVDKATADLKRLGSTSNGKVTLFYKDLDWDTNFFNVKSSEIPFVFPTADATIEDRVNALRMFEALRKLVNSTECEFTTLRVNAHDLATAQAAEQSGFFITDIHTSYFFDKRKQKPEPLSSQYLDTSHVYKCPYSGRSLMRLAQSIFSTNFAHRFHNDPHIAKEKADELYVLLTKHCLENHSSIIVVESDGDPVGFLTLQEHADEIGGVTIGKFGMAGVAPEARGKQIYQNMILQGLHLMQDGIVETTNTGIVNPVQRAWMNLKFKPAYVKLTMHKWRGEMEMRNQRRRKKARAE
jgi:hypothetical protein